jgi:transketolase
MTMSASGPRSRPMAFGPRRAIFVPVTDLLKEGQLPGSALASELIEDLESYDLLYRTLCGVLFNFVPTSGHPGGSISSGRIIASLLFTEFESDLSNPDNSSNDLLVYAAGHKAMGLYAMAALRNEIVRVGVPELLPKEERLQLRLEDLLGFRRNPTTTTPLFREFHAKALDGHPTPTTPGVRVATGASGVGLPAGIGLAFGAIDTYGPNDAPRVHLIEGEGGMTPGRVSEALATAAAAGLSNTYLHLDWNQASIDSNCVCRDGEKAGDYVQWNPLEFAYLHDWNVYGIDDGKDFRQILAGLHAALHFSGNDQPTALVYRTVKGWRYGIEGRGSHGAGHKFLSSEYYASLKEAEDAFGVQFPRHLGDATSDSVEKTFWSTLETFRQIIETTKLGERLGRRIRDRHQAHATRKRTPRPGISDLATIYGPQITAETIPAELQLKPGSESTLRAALGDAFSYINKETRGAVVAAAADLLGSTSVSNIARGFPEGFYHAKANPGARLIACGGICEDAMGAFMAGVSTYGTHIGVGSSYGAFIAALQHIPARLHGIGQQARHEMSGEAMKTMVIVCAHAGLKTGEDGPTHADPQALQLLQENFPRGVGITLTPWEPQELWPLIVAGLRAHPAVLAPFVTRPNEKVPDRGALGFPPAIAAAKGIYALRTADPKGKPYHGSIVLQESGIAYTFVDEVLPKLHADGLRMNIYLVTSAELFDLLPIEEQKQIFPPERAHEAMGISGFTMATMYRWVTSEIGRTHSLHAYSKGRYPGSGQAYKVLEEAGLDGKSQYEAVRRYAEAFAKR